MGFANEHRAKEQVETDYRSTTAILSGDEHYWFDGENYRMGQESPTGRSIGKLDRL